MSLPSRNCRVVVVGVAFIANNTGRRGTTEEEEAPSPPPCYANTSGLVLCMCCTKSSISEGQYIESSVIISPPVEISEIVASAKGTDHPQPPPLAPAADKHNSSSQRDIGLHTTGAVRLQIGQLLESLQEGIRFIPSILRD